MSNYPEKRPSETGASIEQEKTYKGFITMFRIGTAVVVALLVAMAAGLIGGAGFIGSAIVFAILCAASVLMLR